MKSSSILGLTLVLLLCLPLRGLAMAGDLDHPSVALPETMDSGQSAALLKALLDSKPSFLHGHFINAHTTLRYSGNTSALNQFLASLAACAGFEIQLRFDRSLTDAAWVLQHNAWTEPARITIQINPDAPSLDLPALCIPPIRHGNPANPAARAIPEPFRTPAPPNPDR